MRLSDDSNVVPGAFLAFRKTRKLLLFYRLMHFSKTLRSDVNRRGHKMSGDNNNNPANILTSVSGLIDVYPRG